MPKRLILQKLAASVGKRYDPDAVDFVPIGKSADQFLRERGVDPEPQPQTTDDIVASDAGVIVLGEVQCGGMVEARVYDDSDPERVPLIIPKATQAVALKIAGNSMFPGYEPGSYIICVPIDVEQIEQDEDVVIQTGLAEDGRATFKRVTKVIGDVITLAPLNGKHKAMKVDRKDVVRVLRVLGTFKRGRHG